MASGVGSGGGVPYESSSYSRGCTAGVATICRVRDGRVYYNLAVGHLSRLGQA